MLHVNTSDCKSVTSLSCASSEKDARVSVQRVPKPSQSGERPLSDRFTDISTNPFCGRLSFFSQWGLFAPVTRSHTMDGNSATISSSKSSGSLGLMFPPFTPSKFTVALIPIGFVSSFQQPSSGPPGSAIALPGQSSSVSPIGFGLPKTLPRPPSAAVSQRKIRTIGSSPPPS